MKQVGTISWAEGTMLGVVYKKNYNKGLDNTIKFMV